VSLRWAYGVRGLFVHAALLIALGSSAPAGAKDEARDVHILAFGDSLSAGYGLAGGLGFVPQLEDSLRRHGVRAFVTNAAVSGDTAAAGRARLQWTLDGLERKPDLAVVALGGNDMLRGLPPTRTRADMDAILAEFKKRQIKVVVAGMLAAPNLGPRYSSEFNSIFPDLARKYGAALYPFFLAKVAGDRRLSLPDGIHPNFQGIKKMVTGILPTVKKAIGP
jgi:acyl-CoA thioesterase I